jgi:hypothetical protein
MNATTTASPKGRMTLGLVLIAIGLVLTLDQAGILNIQGLGRWWPLFLIGIGIVKLRQPIEDGQRAVGTALLFLGGLLQLLSVLSLGKGWPLIMVAVGGLLLWQAIAGPAPPPSPSAASPLVSELALIGFLKRSLPASELRGGYITAVMGGVELDMRKATIGSLPACLDVLAFWGGIDLKLPPGWVVDSRVLPIMGGVEVKAQSLAERAAAPNLVVRGYAVMGAVVIEN